MIIDLLLIEKTRIRFFDFIPLLNMRKAVNKVYKEFIVSWMKQQNTNSPNIDKIIDTFVKKQ